MADTKGAIEVRVNQTTKPRDAAVGQELGITNIMPASTWQDWSGGSIPEGLMAVGRDPLAPTQDEMVYMLRRDGQAIAMFNLLTLSIRAAFAGSEWIQPETGGEEETAFANLMWTLPPKAGGMSVSSSMFLRQSLLALAHGFSAFEVVRKVPTEGPLAGMVTLDKMGYRDPRTVTFLTDEHGNYQGFRQVTNFGNRRINVTIEPQNSWYFAANEEQNPLYGVSYFEPAFQHYQMKRKLYYVSHLAAQLAAVPGRIGVLPRGASPKQIAEFKEALKNMAFNSAIVTPPDFKVEPFNGNTGFKFIELIDHHNTMMAASILAKFLQQDDRTILVDNGKSDASADLFVQLLEAITSELSDSWSNKLMPQFIDMNFGTGNYPVHRFAPLTDSTKEALMAIFSEVVAATSLNCTPEMVRQVEMKLAERLHLEIDYPEIERQEEEAAAQQQAQMEAQQQAQLDQQNQPQGQNLDGTPVGGQQAPNAPQNQGPQGAQAQQPLKQPVNAPALTNSLEEQGEAINELAVLLSQIIQPEDVPEDFAPEGEVLPEAGE